MRKKAGVISLGCAKNRVDSEVLIGMLCDLGYEMVNDPRQAEVVFVNTCGFIEPAKEESIEAIFEMAEYKKTGNLKKLFVTGCLAQRYARELSEEMPEVDGFMGVADYSRLPEMLRDAQEGQRPIYMRDGDRFFKANRVLTTPGYTAYVKISDGCDNRCSYCAIPLIRGKYRSRPFADIVEECKALARRGVTEITLIAQDTSRYGNDFEQKRSLLPELLKTVAEIEGVHWVRVLYCYPDTSDDRLLDTIANTPKVAPYLDLPLQHIDDEMLLSMNRRGNSDWIKSRIRACRDRGITLRTTMIVGFPGETEEKFQKLMDFLKEARFDRLGAFAYSPEEGTVGAAMPGQIEEEIKNRRLDQLMSLQQAISLEQNQKRVGEICEVLVEGEQEGKYVGRSIREAPESDGSIFFSSSKPLVPGQYVMVQLTGADAYDLFGEEIQ
ncbi:MAG TPA: 30S ribosomal protein S12 methylthiotransferase RimO [Candidatus Pullichristensenella excrementigallinarum]|uniref:Ribosomal protein uS12 methylthiotransferase RimO n=1 Tax=Candidatus Pullichristensenella excrementigallinarum TaxID=2840907 RepID=A0A9D1IEW0_9FIRM|nr:30S ribosomal protein S12 methylthiotransferase RimO [Candidatus Pullichristensenella excrementigallinarum]